MSSSQHDPIADLYLRRILNLPDDAEVCLELEFDLVKGGISPHSANQRKHIVYLYLKFKMVEEKASKNGKNKG